MRRLSLDPRTWSIRFQLMAMTGFLIVLSVSLVSALSYARYVEDFRRQTAAEIRQTLEQLSMNVEGYLDDLFRLSLAPYYNDALMDTLETPPPSEEMAQLGRRRRIEDALDEMMILPRKDILSVYLLADEIYRGGRYPASMDDAQDRQSFAWYRSALLTKETLFVPTHLEQLVENPKYRVFSIVKRLNSLHADNRPLGVIKVDANYSGIEAICRKIGTGHGGSLFILDENGAVVYDSGSGKTRTAGAGLIDVSDGQIDPVLLPSLSAQQAKPEDAVQIGAHRYLLSRVEIASARWSIYSLTDLAELNRNAASTRNRTFWMALACAVFALLILLLFTQRFLHPLFEIVALMRRVEGGDLAVAFPGRRQDVIGFLGAAFDRMVRRVRDMIEERGRMAHEVYEARLLQTEAQIHALTSQIKPHFLYNALNLISMTIQNGQDEDAVACLEQLSSILRSMTGGSGENAVGSEMTLLDAYLSIQKRRYSDRLDFTIDVEPEVAGVIVPSLLFQPMVENCVVHACERRKEKTRIRIVGRRDGEMLQFEIGDDGPGMPPEKLAALREKLRHATEAPSDGSFVAPADGHGVGLLNVHRRIVLRYGKEYGLSVDGAEGAGTVVKIRLPLPGTVVDKGPDTSPVEPV